MTRKMHGWIVTQAYCNQVRAVVTRETLEEARVEAEHQQRIGGPGSYVSIWKRENGTLPVHYQMVEEL